MNIQKPIGSRLLARDLPGGSLVNIHVNESEDELPSLTFVPYRMGNVELTLSDLLYIAEWAQKP